MNLLADVRILVLKRGLEPLRAYRSLVPETSVSTNFTTSALYIKSLFLRKKDFVKVFPAGIFPTDYANLTPILQIKEQKTDFIL